MIVKSVILSKAKDLGIIKVDLSEILPPFGRLDDNWLIFFFL